MKTTAIIIMYIHMSHYFFRISSQRLDGCKYRGTLRINTPFLELNCPLEKCTSFSSLGCVSTLICFSSSRKSSELLACLWYPFLFSSLATASSLLLFIGTFQMIFALGRRWSVYVSSNYHLDSRRPLTAF